MYANGSINRNQIPSSDLHSLFQDNYISNSNNFHDNNVYLTDKGRAYVEEIKSDKYRFWIPVVISLIALFRPEIMSFIKYLATLFIEK
jgi:hypothetical protein